MKMLSFVVILWMCIADVEDQLERAPLFRSFVSSEQFQSWLIAEGKESEPVLATIVLDAQRAIADINSKRGLPSPDNLNEYRRELASVCAGVREAEQKLLGELAASGAANHLRRLQLEYNVFEYERVRNYRERMNLECLLPNVVNILKSVPIDLLAIANRGPSLPEIQMRDAIEMFWSSHIEELASGVSFDQSNRGLYNVAECAVNVLAEWARMSNVDLEIIGVRMLCERYPGLCMRTPVDVAYEVASNMVSEKLVFDLKEVYEGYRQRRSALRAVLASAQSEWDEPSRRQRRQADYARLRATKKSATDAWKGHPGRYAIKELFRLECETVEAIRALIPVEVLDESPPEVKFALLPLER